MNVHHLNCISMCPLGRKAYLACHCLLVETEASLVLIDTGLGLRDVHNPERRASWFFLRLLRPDFREEMTAVRQVRRLGFDPRDVRHIVLTHLDFDHAGGLDDFPGATVHMLEAERMAALSQETWLDRQRYRPQQWSTRDRWRVYQPDEGDMWFGFDRVRIIDGVPPEIAIIPLIGHTFGHAGVAIQRRNRWWLHAGDAYFFHAEMDPDDPWCPADLRLYQRMMDKERRVRRWNQKRLRALRRSHESEIEIFCSHDALEFERLAGRPIEMPVEALVRQPPPVELSHPQPGE